MLVPLILNSFYVTVVFPCPVMFPIAHTSFNLYFSESHSDIGFKILSIFLCNIFNNSFQTEMGIETCHNMLGIWKFHSNKYTSRNDVTS